MRNIYLKRKDRALVHSQHIRSSNVRLQTGANINMNSSDCKYKLRMIRQSAALRLFHYSVDCLQYAISCGYVSHHLGVLSYRV